jgi:hypothetical protein
LTVAGHVDAQSVGQARFVDEDETGQLGFEMEINAPRHRIHAARAEDNMLFRSRTRDVSLK